MTRILVPALVLLAACGARSELSSFDAGVGDAGRPIVVEEVYFRDRCTSCGATHWEHVYFCDGWAASLYGGDGLGGPLTRWRYDARTGVLDAPTCTSLLTATCTLPCDPVVRSSREELLSAPPDRPGGEAGPFVPYDPALHPPMERLSCEQLASWLASCP